MNLTACLTAHIERASRLLQANASGSEVHEARKELKYARAILQLSRKVLSSRQYDHLRVKLRQAAHSLSELRDSEVSVQTCTALLTCCTKNTERAVLQDLVRLLRLRHARLLQRRQRDTAAARAYLREALRTPVMLDAVQNSDITDGVRRSYVRGRKLFRSNVDRPSDARLHTWRRRTNTLRYQLQIVADEIAGFARPIKRLSKLLDLLGMDHDLLVVRLMLEAAPISLPIEAASKLLRRQQVDIRERALRLGSRIYARKPRRFVDRCARHQAAR